LGLDRGARDQLAAFDQAVFDAGALDQFQFVRFAAGRQVL
jgi:hypothetical protein